LSSSLSFLQLAITSTIISSAVNLNNAFIKI
jgi:hypothetical protein